MSQLLTEALQEVRWAEEQLEAAAAAVLARNGTHARNDTRAATAGLAKLPPMFGQPKLWWLPAEEQLLAAEVAKLAKPANASAAPRLPPWAPASLILHWPAAREAANLSLPRLHRRRRGVPAPQQGAQPAQGAKGAQPAQFPRARRLLQLQGWVSEDEPNTGQQVMHHVPAAEPHQLAGVPELADFYSIKQHAWSRANHSGALGAAPCAGCAAVLACADALALAVTATALLTCLLTLVCVWLLARRAGFPALLARLPAPRPAKQLVELPPGEVPHMQAHAAALAPASDKV
jgi:hypothetical protein